MPTNLPPILIEIQYAEAAREYLRNLPPEHFMEGTAQARQREVSVESFAVLKTRRKDVQYFNELLIQYPTGRPPVIRQVVPDNMLVLDEEEIEADGSYDVPLQRARPFFVLEYVSKNNRRKDYETSYKKHEKDLKVPYYLLFVPDHQELTLFKHTGRKYVSVKPNERDRYAIPEIDLELALLDGWVRYWHEGELLPLPEDLVAALVAERQRADEERRRADEERRRADEERRRADEAERHLAEKEQANQDLQRQLAELRAQLGQKPPGRKNGR